MSLFFHHERMRSEAWSVMELIMFDYCYIIVTIIVSFSVKGVADRKIFSHLSCGTIKNCYNVRQTLQGAMKTFYVHTMQPQYVSILWKSRQTSDMIHLIVFACNIVFYWGHKNTFYNVFRLHEKFMGKDAVQDHPRDSSSVDGL